MPVYMRLSIRQHVEKYAGMAQQIVKYHVMHLSCLLVPYRSTYLPHGILAKLHLMRSRNKTGLFIFGELLTHVLNCPDTVTYSLVGALAAMTAAFAVDVDAALCP